jgi:hypothetical protein
VRDRGSLPPEYNDIALYARAASKGNQRYFVLRADLDDAGNVIGSLPYTITYSGSYELESNLTYAGKQNAIEVNADNVVINLNGFSINTTGTGVFGVIIQKYANLTVQNGSILGFQGAVILAGPQSKAVNLQLVNNVFGVQVLAKACAVQNCFIIGRAQTQTVTESNSSNRHRASW